MRQEEYEEVRKIYKDKRHKAQMSLVEVTR